MVRNLTTWKNDSTRNRNRRSAPAELDQIQELETENALLRARVADLVRQLEEQPLGEPHELNPASDDEMEAFEAFLSESDPHIDRVQRFLLG